MRERLRTPLGPDERHVILFTGIGGIGKSALARHILRELQETHGTTGWLGSARPAWAAIDLAEDWSRNINQALLQLRLQLGVTWPEARFPVFDFAFARLHEARFPSADPLRSYGLLDPDGAVARRFTRSLPPALRDTELLQDAADGINELIAEVPLLGTTYKYLNRVVARGLDPLDRRTEPLLDEIAQTSPELLEQLLPECLGTDLRNAILVADQRRPLLVVVDTLEALHRDKAATSGIHASANDAWLRELIWQVPGVGFVLLGRDPVEWADFEHSPLRKWQEIIRHRPLRELDDEEVDAILTAFPVVKPAIREVMREGAAGLPFHLGLQLDIYRDLSAEGTRPTPEHFARKPALVLTRFADHLGERLRTALTTLAHARHFDQQLLAFLTDQPGQLLGPVGLPEITRYSVVEGDPESGFRLHQHYQDIAREDLARHNPARQRRIDEALFAYWDAKCQPPDLRSLDAARETALREAARHQRLLAPEEHTAWLAKRWPPFQQAARLQLCQQLWEVALITAERANGSGSAEAATALGSLGIVQTMQGRLDNARAAQERALVIKEKVHGLEHHEVATTLNNLGIVLQKLELLDDALVAQTRALSIHEKVHGPDKYEVAVTLGNLGNVLQMMDRLDDAGAALQRALAIKEKLFGHGHLEVAITLGYYGIVLRLLGQLDDARAVQERALAIKTNVYGPEHHEVAESLGNLGIVLKQLDDLPAAQAAEERALLIFERRLPPAHPFIAQACENLAGTLDRLGNTERAAELRARAAAIWGRDR